jgi:molybdate transport system substrate-binding protein
MRARIAAIAIALCALPAAVGAAEIKVISTHNIEPVLDDLQGPFERASGHKVTIEAQGAAATRRRIEAGDAGDVVFNSRAVLDGLVKAGRIRSGSITDVAHSSIGVVVRTGQPKPDISTDAALRTALLQARSIAYPDPAKGSLAGNYLAGLIERWGIADQLKAKSKLAAGGAPAAHLVAAGEAEIGLNQIVEFMTVSGIEFVTPLPPALTDKVVMSAGVLSDAREPDAAAQWIKFVASPAAAKALAAHGLAP